MDRELIEKLVDRLLFSKEAAEYLGISSQRLNQLVHSGQLKPVKKTSAGALFLKEDLDERLKSVKNIAADINNGKYEAISLQSPYMQEVLNYYTQQSMFNYSDKKTEPLFKDLSSKVDVRLDINYISKDISQLLGLDEHHLLKSYSLVARSFEKLNKNDYIIRKGMK